jgi:hypothetical protein
LKFFENFARQCPEKDFEEVSVRLRIFSKNGGAVPEALRTQMAGRLAFKP